MVRLAVALDAPNARVAQDFLDAFRFLGVSVRIEPGCLGCSNWIDADMTVHYSEEWATEEDMRQRVRSDQFTSLLAVVEAARDPQVQFDFVMERRGLDYVMEVRADNAT